MFIILFRLLFNQSLITTKILDEEIGGGTGFGPFIETKEFKDLNVGFAFDEGQVSPTEEIGIYYTERLVWCMRFFKVICIYRYLKKWLAELIFLNPN